MPFKTRFLVFFELFFYRWFSRLVAVSEPIKSILVEEGIKESEIDVVPNGVDTSVISNKDEVRQKIRAELDIKDDTFVLINSGRLTKQKAQWMLVEAAKKLNEGNSDFLFIIIGEGELKAELTNRIEKLKLMHCVKLLGFCSEVKEMLAAADCFVLPSIDEGMPMSLLEAVSAELPVISTQVGDIAKLIEHDQSGLVIPLDDSDALVNEIECMIKTPEKRSKLAMNAKKKMVQLYSSDAMANNYSQIYSAIVETGNS
jgi:glycosyltransferase involved in cell wall biosynthesis